MGSGATGPSGMTSNEYRERYYDPAVRLADRLDALAREAKERLGFEGIASAIEDTAMYARWNAAECLGDSTGDWGELGRVEQDAELVARAKSIWKADVERFLPDARMHSDYRGSSRPGEGERN